MSAPASAICPRCRAFAPMLPIVFGAIEEGALPRASLE
jgi:hypothetical protein